MARAATALPRSVKSVSRFENAQRAAIIGAAPKGRTSITAVPGGAAEAAGDSRGCDPFEEIKTNSGVRAEMTTKEVELSKLSPPVSKPFPDPVKVERYAAFDWKKYQPIIVEQDGMRLTIQEGMTRVELARRAGITKLPAYVFPVSGR
jgi:hypothetical protein